MAKVSSTLTLAKHLGLSEWTVSRAINGHPEVKTATRERILKAMDEIGFRPNPVARALSGKAMNIVGVCFGNTHNVVMLDKITLLDEFLRNHQLRAILSISPKDEASEIQILEDFRHLRVDGIVMVGSYLFRHQLKKVLKDQRCVHIDPADQSLLPSVSFDRNQAIQLAVNHLYELGHRHFGTFGFSRNNNAARWQGIVESLSVRGIDPERNVQVFVLDDLGSESYGEGIRLVELFLSAKKRPTALIAVNDRVAFGAIQGFRDAGVRIPEDVSMVGFGNLSMSRYLRPTLTTIDLQPQLQIQKAGNLLLKQLRESGPPEEESRLSVEPLLIVRESTGPAQRRP